MDDLREILGYVARWLVLGIATGLGVIVVGTGFVAAGEVVPDSGGQLVTSDVFLLRDGPAAELLLLAKATPELGPVGEKVLCQISDGRFWVTRLSSRLRDLHVLRSYLSGPVEEARRFRISGVPYGRRTFQSDEITVLHRPPDRALWLLDAAMVTGATWDDPVVGEMVNLLRGRGYVAWMFGGPIEQYAAWRDRMRALDAAAPVLYTGSDDPIVWNALRLVVQASGFGYVSISLVTGDRDLARSSAALGVTPHLIRPPGSGVTSSANVVAHNSLALFKGYLLGLPIGEGANAPAQ